ncbi:uncharacterized protein LOC120850229 [Ixodes scapularis]|uniref:uncharacterized protein LOC120850229 n=1 Tax=Ixodes scapularis TaxID=6945 RepID=UPI001A9F8157|nr:uncharacterized protein LOC120850229 [Ixodes scapularis]
MEWEKDIQFRGWNSKSTKGNNYVFCKACCVHLTAGKCDLEKHAATRKHWSNAKKLIGQQTLLSMPSTSQATHKGNQCVRQCCKNKIACSRTKATAIVKNVTGHQSKEELCEPLRNNKFSLMVDESTDGSCCKLLCLVTRVFNGERVVDAFFDLLQIQDATARTLYEHIVKAFTDWRIPCKENMIRFAADGANVMMGTRNSVMTLLRQDIPKLFTMKCVCHSFHLCASYASEKLPRVVEDQVRDIHNYFHSSPKRQGRLKAFQAFLESEPHKLLHASQTRWLSLHSVVTRVLEQYEPLKYFFAEEVGTSRLLAPQTIYKGWKTRLFGCTWSSWSSSSLFLRT